jgi:hypothetical protein
MRSLRDTPRRPQGMGSGGIYRLTGGSAMTTYYAVNHEDVWLLDGSSTGNVIHLQLPCTARVTARECWLLLGQGDVEGAADKLSDMLELNDWDQRAANDPRFVFFMKVSAALQGTLTTDMVRALVAQMLAIGD